MIDAQQQSQGQPLWTVGVPKQTTIPDQSRGYIAGWEIPVVMFDKSSFTVTVPADQFTPEAVQAVIEDHVNRLVAVRSLKGSEY